MDFEELKAWGVSKNVKIENELKKMFVFDDTILYLSGNTLYGNGKNINSLFQLQNLTRNVTQTADNLKLVAYNDTRFRDFTTNGVHALAISENGDLFSWGCNDNFQLGRAVNISNNIDFVTLVLGVSISQAACGNKFSFVLTEEGKLIEWGCYGAKVYDLLVSNDKEDTSNDKGDTSNDEDTAISETEDLPSEVVDSITCTDFYPLVLTKTGKIFVPNLPCKVTSNDSYTKDQLHEFGLSLKNKKVIQLLNGRTYIYALTNDGEIYRWKSHKIIANSPEHLVVKFGRAIKLWTTRTADIIVAVNSYRKLFSICGMNEELFVSELTYSSAGMYFISKRLKMEGPIYTNMYNKDQNLVKATDHWREKFKLAFNEKDGSDITFNVDGQLIYAHRAIVSIQSSFLEALLKTNWFENSDSRIIKIKHYTYTTYERFLKYLYTGDLELSSQEFNLELLQLSHEYKHETLLKICEKMVETGITIDNVYQTYKMATLLELLDLKSTCKIFMSKHLESIIISDEVENEDKEALVCFLRDMVLSGSIRGMK